MTNLQEIFGEAISATRSKIIDDAVKIEYIIDGIVASTFGIGTPKALSVGNKSSALSFLQKINLLFDIKFVQEHHKPKFICLAEIRNQFAHDFNTKELTDCKKEYLDKLKKFYPIIAKTSPLPCDQLYNKLYEDIEEYSLYLYNLIIEKAGNKGSMVGTLKFYEIFNEILATHFATDPDFEKQYFKLWKKAEESFKGTPIEPGEEMQPIL